MWIGILAGMYATYATLGFSLQRNLVFAGKGEQRATPRDLPQDLERWWNTVDGAEVESWFHPAKPADAAEPRPLVVFFHGNAEAIDDWLLALQPIREAGFHLLLVEYPGYVRSGGAPSQASLTAAAAAAYDQAVARDDVDGERVIAWGRSLGGGVACALAAVRPVRGLMLRSTFTSLRPFALRMGLPPALVRDPFDNLRVVRAFEGPIQIWHGDRDRTVPIAHAEEMARAAGERGQFERRSCGHNDCALEWEPILAWLNEAAVPRGEAP